MLNLKIYHMVHLSKEQRYAIHNGADLVVVGITIPVWDINNQTNEPAKEFFSRYYLNNIKEQDVPILILDDGFEISLPYRKAIFPPITDDEWRAWTFHNPHRLTDYYKKCKSEVSSLNLLNAEDGGGRHMYYRENNKLNRHNELLNIWHFINISSTEELAESLC